MMRFESWPFYKWINKRVLLWFLVVLINLLLFLLNMCTISLLILFLSFLLLGVSKTSCILEIFMFLKVIRRVKFFFLQNMIKDKCDEYVVVVTYILPSRRLFFLYIAKFSLSQCCLLCNHIFILINFVNLELEINERYGLFDDSFILTESELFPSIFF